MNNSENYEEMNEKIYEDAFEKSYSEKETKFNEIIRQKLVISLYGDVNVGKSKTINALTGKKLADVRAISGWTKEIKLYQYSENVFIADTPGLKDINKENSKKTEEFVEKDSDIILFFINATVGLKDYEKEAFINLKKLKKPMVAILNKIDAEPNYIEPQEQAEGQIGQRIIPISAIEETNIKELNNEIIKILETKGKDILFLKISKFKEEKVKNWINGATITAFGIGTIPIPGADIVPLTSLQVGLALKIAYIYNCRVSKKDVMSLLASTVTGSMGKQLYKLGIQAMKAAGWLGGPFGTAAIAALAGSIAASITYGFGRACNAYYKSGMTMDLGEVGEIYNEMFKQYKKKKRES